MSVPVNLVEGAERDSEKEFCRCLEISGGSASEVRYLLSVARRLGLLSAAPIAELEDGYDHVVRALHNLRRTVRSGMRRR